MVMMVMVVAPQHPRAAEPRIAVLPVPVAIVVMMVVMVMMPVAVPLHLDHPGGLGVVLGVGDFQSLNGIRNRLQ